jgi:tetratricopeptide (TPR) repeat protein
LLTGGFAFMVVGTEAFNTQPGTCNVSGLQTLTDLLTGSASQAAREAWHTVIRAVSLNWRLPPEQGSDPELRYRQAVATVRSDPLEASERRFSNLLEAHPTSFYALQEHAQILDRMGQRDAALAGHELARRSRQRAGRGMPDRPFFTRHRTTSVAEIDGYTHVMRAGASKKGVFAYVARGHAYLATQRPRLAILDYEAALRLAPDKTDLLIAVGEALATLGRHGDALRVLDRAVAALPNDPEPLSSRAFALLGLDRLAQADADWLRQLELLPRDRHGARACVLLRLAQYESAVNELEQAIERQPRDAYLQLYHLMSLRRIGRRVAPKPAPSDIWPGPLIGLHNGTLYPDEALKLADSPERRAEALFQLGILAYDHDRLEAGRLWRQVAEVARPDMIEYAAARHEVERLGTVSQPTTDGRATQRGAPMMANAK